MTDNDCKVLFNSYKRFPITFVRGDGALLFDDTGKQYIDLLAGIAVVCAGHANPRVSAAVASQLFSLTHISNFFWNDHLIPLATKLQEINGGWGRAFFCNSGAEAVECAIKLVRKWGSTATPQKRYKIICADGCFHGRTMGALASTGQPAKKVGFEPMLEGFTHLPFNDIEAFARAVDDQTAALFIEPVQGELGVVPATQQFLVGLRELADRAKIALIFDEVQTGVGRTGRWWAYQHYGVKPDIFTSAKGLANGLPIGACIADEPYASVFEPGDHGTTFGGGPAVCCAALETIRFLEESGTLAAVTHRGDYLAALLQKVAGVKLVRGMGLMRGVVLERPVAKALVANCLTQGIILNACSDDTLRFVPPLVITEAQIAEAVQVMSRELAKLP